MKVKGAMAATGNCYKPGCRERGERVALRLGSHKDASRVTYLCRGHGDQLAVLLTAFLGARLMAGPAGSERPWPVTLGDRMGEVGT